MSDRSFSARGHYFEVGIPLVVFSFFILKIATEDGGSLEVSNEDRKVLVKAMSLHEKGIAVHA